MANGKKVWFKWNNGKIHKVYIYKTYVGENETFHHARSGRRYFMLKQSDYGKTWANTKEELEK